MRINVKFLLVNHQKSLVCKATTQYMHSLKALLKSDVFCGCEYEAKLVCVALNLNSTTTSTNPWLESSHRSTFIFLLFSFLFYTSLKNMLLIVFLPILCVAQSLQTEHLWSKNAWFYISWMDTHVTPIKFSTVCVVWWHSYTTNVQTHRTHRWFSERVCKFACGLWAYLRESPLPKYAKISLMAYE